ncbi:MAG TPA: non-ribosomal peptide synthetase [Desulfobacteraceae bacterium]|nr:non-ribosomal peptide synthetase [Desulfobacteraceae bacterium]
MAHKIDVSRMSRAQKQAMLKELMKKKRKAAYYPLSSGQKGLWFLQRMKPDSHAYNVPCAFKLKGTVDDDALKRAFAALTERHPILRSVFKTTEDGEPLQSVAFAPKLFFRTESIAHMEDSRIAPFLRTIVRTPFDLEKGPLFRVYLFRRSDTESILLVNLHHIIFDGSSFPVFADELMTLYRAQVTGENLRLPHVNASYSRYVAWQQKMLAGDEGWEHKAYWLDVLYGDLPVLNLPADMGPADATKTAAGGCETVRREICADLTRKIRQVAADNGVYLFTVLLSAYKVLLHRYSGQDDIITGIPMAGRNRTEFEDLIGYFINMVPVRTRLSGQTTFADLMAQVHAASMGAMAHQDYPFPEIVKALRESGWSDNSDSPLFQTSFVLQNWAKGIEARFGEGPDQGKGQENATGFRPELMLNIQQEEDFNLSLEVLDLDRLQFFFKYDAGLYRRETVIRMAEHFTRLLEGIAENPDREISSLPLLTAKDRRIMLTEWNDTATDYPKTCLHRLIEDRVDDTPDAAALISGTMQLTYGQLNARTNQVGRYLQKLGVAPGTRVAICMERSPEMVIGLLGIMKAGGTYVPVDPEYPEDRIRYMLEDTQAPLLVTQEKLLDRLPTHAAKPVCLDREWDAVSREDEANIKSCVTPDDLAYIIYTSGSTGKPKGVMIRHRGLPNLARAQIRLFGVTPSSRVLQFASMSFDASISEIAMAFCSGAALCMGTKDELLPGENLENTLIRHGVTHVTLPPSALSVMAPEKLAGLSTIVVAGEACPPELAALWAENRTFINAYGPSESTVCASGMRYDAGCAPSPGGRIPIGKPIDNIRLYILDSHLQPVPVGVPGELHIGGAGLAQGYLNRPGLTDRAFISNPFDAEKRSRLYKTGDLCRYLPDGNIEFLGRMDHQIKIRGFRIELGEIESVLREHGQIREAVVVARETKACGKQLVAYFTPENPKAVPTQGELRASLKATLPDFMIPAPFVCLEAMPLTPNGKIDRKRLPAPDPGLIRETSFEAPRTKTEARLGAIWETVLKIQNVSIHDDFFMMGGHSLLATVVISRIQKAFNVHIPVTGLFDYPTIAEFGHYLEGVLQVDRASHSTIRPADREQPLALSFGQQRLWFLDKFEGSNSASYNVPLAFKVSGPMDIPALNRAVNEIVRRHEVLRTVFKDPAKNKAGKNGSSAPVQVILPELQVDLTLADAGFDDRLDTNLPTDRDKRAARIVSHECLKPFNLSQGPLIRVLLVRKTDREHLLLITLHHIVFDGWSAGVFMKELEQLYAAYTLGKPSPLTEPDIQYADFARWQRDTLQGDTLAAHMAYWKNQLAGSPLSTELPTDYPRPPVQTFNGDVVRFHLGPALAEKLTALCRASGVTLFMALYAAFATLLSRYNGKTDIVIGSPVANRTHGQTEDLIGFFVNTLALRADLSGTPSFTALLARVKQCTTDAYAHQDLPFERLILSEGLNIRRSMSHSPLFQVMFDLHNVTGEECLKTGGLTFNPFDIDFNVAKFDLSLSMVAGDLSGSGEGGISGRFEYNTDLFDRGTIERMAGHFNTLLADAAAHPEKKISELSILTRPEINQLVHEFNDTRTDVPQEQCVHQLFEAWAQKTPEATAVIFDDIPMTYGELNRRANQVARFLRRRGVGPDVLVGLHMERSFELVTGLLGILKAGGAYVPLDPGYPGERIAYMVSDAGTPVVLTQAALADQFPETCAELICLDDGWEAIAGEPADNVSCDVTPGNLIYVIYTSGTTGRPKGVLIEHRSVRARVADYLERYNLTADDITIHYRPYSFDGTIEEYLLPLLHGGRYVMAPPGISMTDNVAAFLMNAAQRYGLTRLHLPPALLDVFLTELERTGNQQIGTVTTIFTGGDRLSRDILYKFHAMFGEGKAFFNCYGPTENTNDSLVWRCSVEETQGRVVIGKPIANSQAYVLDAHMQLVPVGVPGELYVSGIGLARGYLNRPDLTDDAFLPHPFDRSKDARIYRTGDLCRCLPDGNIEFLGRVDHQVKIRGFRIELSEIESVLVGHDRVAEAIVIAREDRPGNKQLAAYVTPAEGGEVPGPEELKAYLKQILPDYMIPPFIIVLDALPATSNGKFDRNALPAPDFSGMSATYTRPATQNEILLAEVWAETLGLDRVGIHDNFFSLGGNSITSIRMMAKAEEKGLSLTVKQIFEHQTIAELALAAASPAKDASGRSATNLTQFPELIRLNKVTEGAPVFWIHGGLGGVGAYLSLAKRISRPFYGIQARGWMSDRSPLSGIPEKASYYLKIIRAVQPEGPYHLGGYSHGGTVAYEMTRQLQEQGESVASIVMLDSSPDPDTGSDPANGTPPGVFNRKQAMLQAVNIALFEAALSGTQTAAQTLIHRDELPAEGDDDGFLDALVSHPRVKGLFDTGENAAAQIQSIVGTLEKSHAETYRIRPLPEPDAVACHYFRNKGGRLLGDLAPYFCMEGEGVEEREGYWKAWQDHISDFRLIDVDSPNHMAMLADARSLEDIARGCERLYSTQRIPEAMLN